MGAAKTVKIRLRIVEGAEVKLVQPNDTRLPRPRPNLDALPKLKALKGVNDKANSAEWWEVFLEYLSRDRKDRDNIRDLVLSKLPTAKLFAVGCVPSYRDRMLNYAKNPFLEGHLCHKKEYWLTSFCIKEEEVVEEVIEVDKNQKEKKEGDKEDAEGEEGKERDKKDGEAQKSVKSEEPKPNKSLKEGSEIQLDAPPAFVIPEFDDMLEGVDLNDAHVQLELLEGEQYVMMGKVVIRGENDNYVQLKSKPYIELKFETKKGDLKYGSATVGLQVVSLSELLRKMQAYHIGRKEWMTMPSLNFLPPKVNGMLAGEGGLLLLSGDIRPYVDPNAPKPEEQKSEKPKTDKNPGEAELPVKGEEGVNGEKKPEGGKKVSIKPKEDKPPPPEEEGAATEASGEEGEGTEEDAKEEKSKKEKKAEEKKPGTYKPPESPPQHILVVCNPIARTYRVLPPMHVNLEKLVAHLKVNPSSSSYIVYVVGWHRRIKECVEAEGMRVAMYKSTTQQWTLFCVPACRIFRPEQSCFARALPLVTKLFEGPTLFMGGEVATNLTGEYVPIVLGYRLRTRSWKGYGWPPLTVTESPQVVECNGNLYIVARGASEPATINIWKFSQFVYDVPDCKQVTMMPQNLFSMAFVSGFRKAKFDCVASMDCISIVSREKAYMIVSYNVTTKKWLEPLKRYPGFVRGETFLGNWLYEPVPHALV